MPHVSASQGDNWEDCKRMWALSRRRPRTTSAPAEFGNVVHDHSEGWLQFGTVPPDTPEGRCTIAGLEIMPLPRTCWVEHTFRFASDGVNVVMLDTREEVGPDGRPRWVVQYEHPPGWVEYTGRIDALYGLDPGRIVVVLDHKSTGDLKWLKTPEQLATDLQRIMYTFFAAHYFGVAAVVAQWNYYRHKPPKAVPSVLVEDAATIKGRFQHAHHRVGLPVYQAHAHLNATERIEDFPRTLTACGKYGGCDYKTECLANVSPIEIAAAALKETGP